MKNKKTRIAFIILCLLDVYLFSFFYVFHRLNITIDLVVEERQEATGPKGVSVVLPVGNSYIRKSLYYLYYPIHAPLKIKGWIYPMYEYDDFADME